MAKKVVIIGKVWPEPGSSAAGGRMMQLIEVFLSEGWEVSFASAANKSEFTADLNSLGVNTCPIELNNTSFDSFIKEKDPEIVLFDRFTTEEQFGWRVAEQCPNALRILDTEDLHCLRAARHTALKEKRDLDRTDLFCEVSKREIASIYRCDLSLIISEYEMQILKNVFKVEEFLLHYIPFLLEAPQEEQIAGLPGFSERKGFITIGNFLHEPNWDAVLYLKQKIWPLIRERLPQAELNVYGAYPSQKVYELQNLKEGFLIKGRAPAVSEVMRVSRVCLAPLRFGAGIKGKLTDAMMYGTPSVTTGIGSESMHGELPWSGKIANGEDEIANAAVELYSDEALWKQCQVNGYRIIRGLFSKEKFSTGLISKIENVQKNLVQHRLENFTGAMLTHHTTLSSRYMALWIESKNKLTRT